MLKPLGEALSEISAARWRQSERAKADDGSAARGHLSRTLLLIRTLIEYVLAPRDLKRPIREADINPGSTHVRFVP
jgi:hypothetical protein